MESAEQFAKYLREGIYSIKAREGKNIGIIKEELAGLINLAPSTIDHWYKKRGTPTQTEYVKKVAQEIIRRGHMDERWLKNFVTSAGYPYLMEPLTQKIFPSVQKSRDNILAQENRLPLKQLSLATQRQESRLEKTIDWSTLQNVCQEIQAISIENIKKKYDPMLYLQRQEAVDIFESFLTSSQQILVITGKSGVGKTNFVYSLLDGPSSEQFCFLGYDSTYLEEGVALLTQLNQDFQRCGGQSDFVMTLKAVLKSDGIGKSQRYIVLLIDALNEHNQPAALLRDIDRSIHRLDTPWLKVVITARPEAWRQIYRQTKPLTERLYYRSHNVQSGESEIGFELTEFHTEFFQEEATDLSYRLPLFERGEIEQAYENYRCKYHLQTSYHSLNQTVQGMIRDPLALSLIAQIYRQRDIPSTLHLSEIYRRYIDFIIDIGKLNIESEIFLRKVFLPLMVKGRPYRNEITYEELRWRLQSEKDMNCLNNLIDTDILIRSSNASDEVVRFTFERFYDYFVGRYFLQKSEEEIEPAIFIEDLAAQIIETPFLWGPVTILLYESFLKQDDNLIEQLGHSQNEMLLQMVMKLLDEQYASHTIRIQALLRSWLAQVNERKSQTPRIVAYIAINHKVETLLTSLLLHPDKKVRYLVVQDIYTLWQQDQELTRQILQKLTKHIKNPFSPLLFTLIDVSFLLFLREYQAQTATVGEEDTMIQATTLPELHQMRSNPKTNDIEAPKVLKKIWQPTLSRWLGGNIPLQYTLIQPLRNSLLRLLIGAKALSFIGQGQRERFSFDFASMKTLFPLTTQRQKVMQQLVAHFDASIGRAPGSIDDLTQLIYQQIEQGEENFWIIYTAHLSLASHLKADPLSVTASIQKLLGRIEVLYPPPEHLNRSPQQSTIPIWYPMLSHVFLNLRHNDYAAIGQENARKVLRTYMSILRRRVYAYGDQWRRDPVANRRSFDEGTLHLDCLEPLLYGYVLNIPEAGRDMLLELVQYYISTEDIDHIQWGVYSLAMGMNRHELPEVGLEALGDFIYTIQESGYLEELEPNIYDELWEKWEEDLFKYASKYRDKLADLLTMLDAQKTPDKFKLRLENVDWQDHVIDFDFIEGITWLVSKATQDSNPDSSVRQMMVWFFKNSIHAKNVQQVMVDLLIRFLNDGLS